MTLQLLLLTALPTACHHKFWIALIPATFSNRKADGAARRLKSCSAAAHSSAAQILWCQQQADQPLKQCTSCFHRSNVSLKARCKSTRRHSVRATSISLCTMGEHALIPLHSKFLNIVSSFIEIIARTCIFAISSVCHILEINK
jgi:hypothetical protein